MDKEYKFNTTDINEITGILLKKFHSEGFKSDDIADKLGISRRTIYRLYKKHNIDISKVSKNEEEVIKRLIKKGYKIEKSN